MLTNTLQIDKSIEPNCMNSSFVLLEFKKPNVVLEKKIFERVFSCYDDSMIKMQREYLRT